MKTKIHALLIPILFISLLSGCATTKLTQEQIDNGDYGPPPPSNYQEVIKELFYGVLKDPESARYRFQEPYKGWITKAPIMGGGVDRFGWFVKVGINAKNSYGGYTGEKTYTMFYKNGKWEDVSYLSF